jgi:hypothetical protein
MDSKFLKNSLGMMKVMKGANLTKLTDQTLLDYHRKCNILYAGNLRHSPPNKSFINSIVMLHNTLVNEMEKRKIKHNTPLKKL